MAMYTLGISVLQSQLSYRETNVKSAAYADDYFGAGKIQNLKQWWNRLKDIGPLHGYLPNADKTWLIVKEGKEDEAQRIFADTNIQITCEGKRHLGAVIGSTGFKEQYVKNKVQEWTKEVNKLSEIARTEPHAAYTAFTFGLKHKWTYVSRTVPRIRDLMQPLENSIRNSFIPAITKDHQCTDIERDLLELPPRMGGLGIVNPAKMAEKEYNNSTRLTASLKDVIIRQDTVGEIDESEIQRLKSEISKNRQKEQENECMRILSLLPEKTRKKVELAMETGASNWTSSLPIKAKGFSLNKQEFTDALALRYGWKIEGLPDQCLSCEDQPRFDQQHAMTCKKGGFISMRHDEVRDLTFEMLKEVCKDVSKEPQLQPLSGETFAYRTANRDPEARVDVSARGFWTRGQKAFFDVRIFEPSADCYQNMDLQAAHLKNEREKMRKYGERIRNVEQGTFTPLVFTTSGGMAYQAKMFYSRLADLMSEKKGEPKGYFTAWLRVRLSFALLRSAILCLRGSRSSGMKKVMVDDLDYEEGVLEGRIRLDE